jgi:hypothetical protein
MITDIDIRVDADVLDAIDDQLRQSPGLMETAFKRQVRNTRRRILTQLEQLDPGPVQYPIRWKSDRQRRAYFATNGFGNGIPYQRTGDLLNSYTLDISSSAQGGLLTLGNTAPYARFVIGDSQQPFHIDTGWEFVGRTVNRIQDELTNDLIETWFTVADPFAGVPL